jgi:sugar lactone lactonase YvrE
MRITQTSSVGAGSARLISSLLHLHDHLSVLIAFVLVWLMMTAVIAAALEDPPALITTWGSYGSGNGQFNVVSDVGVGPNDWIYVADSNNHRIQVFDSAGSYLFQWGSQGSGNGQFRNPDGFAFDAADGSVYVMEYGGHRVQKFDANGTFILKFGTAGNREGQFSQPSGGAVDANGNVYIADRVNHRIQVFDAQGNFLLMWGWGVATGASQLEVCTSNCRQGISGTAPSQFIYPTGIAFDSGGDLYVAGHWRHAVHKFRTDGTFIAEWSTDPHGPVGIAIDASDNVYTVSWNQGNVYKQTSDGTLLTSWGGFNNSHGVSVDSDGYVYVADTGNHRVMKFGYDLDADGVIDAIDNCPDVYNPEQIDTDEDGMGDDCDLVTYVFSGFFAPIDNEVLNQAKAGQIIPIKWHLSDLAGDFIDDPGSFVRVTSVDFNCDDASIGTDEIEEYAAGSSGLQYLGDGNWQFNWKTQKSYAGQCRIMRLNLADQEGITSTRTAEFQFK